MTKLITSQMGYPLSYSAPQTPNSHQVTANTQNDFLSDTIIALATLAILEKKFIHDLN